MYYKIFVQGQKTAIRIRAIGNRIDRGMTVYTFFLYVSVMGNRLAINGFVERHTANINGGKRTFSLLVRT